MKWNRCINRKMLKITLNSSSVSLPSRNSEGLEGEWAFTLYYDNYWLSFHLIIYAMKYIQMAGKQENSRQCEMQHYCCVIAWWSRGGDARKLKYNVNLSNWAIERVGWRRFDSTLILRIHFCCVIVTVACIPSSAESVSDSPARFISLLHHLFRNQPLCRLDMRICYFPSHTDW